MPRVTLAMIFASQGLPEEAEDAMADAKRIHPEIKAEEIQPLIGRSGVKILRKAGLLG